MGMARDMSQRNTRARVDTLQRHGLINNARQLITQHGYVVNSKTVAELLGTSSWVPTAVSDFIGSQTIYEL